MKSHQNLLVFLLLILPSCATQQGIREDIDLDTLLKHACHPGESSEEIKGSVWMKASSKDSSGKFPASVLAKRGGYLDLEVNNLLGSTEATIRIRKGSVDIEVPDQNKKMSKSGVVSWRGIPLHWASDLFLGKIPCPHENNKNKAKLSRDEKGSLVVESLNDSGQSEKFVYTFELVGGKPWVSQMSWEILKSTQPIIQFEFSTPDDQTLSPLVWGAESSQGSVKVKWKQREAKLVQ